MADAKPKLAPPAPPPSRQAGIEKAAVLLLTLGPDAAGQIFKLGYTLLQLFVFIEENLRLVAYQSESLPKDFGAAVLSDEIVY